MNNRDPLPALSVRRKHVRGGGHAEHLL